MTPAEQTTVDRPDTRRRDGTEMTLLVVAGAAVLPFGLASLTFGDRLAQVDPTSVAVDRIRPGEPIDLLWIWLLMYAAAIVVLLAGVPRPGPLWSARGSLRGAVVQAVGGLVVAGETFAVHYAGFYFGDCTYAGCWPWTEQAAALAAPGVSAGLAMLVMAVLVCEVPWWVRAVVPLVVFLTTLTVQYAVWDAYLVPIFQAPPR
ncbi:hypothetical protein BWI15_30155 [Kribbella sp. ALI-6-A]|uniref:hypothetical protein n=1 Tax=Kribbella sp. ALI-6-A TaxID=1933817 RepID=UPI00097C4D78|nr:hypothetical protein [Kribbella sp. ALI-6-A]ONI67397.1 hypothetical protein BWI15_30155 [Kribbella sp. ALI-6-A]